MKKIDAVAMVRNIRDKQSKELTGRSPQEIINYFRRKARNPAEKPLFFAKGHIKGKWGNHLYQILQKAIIY
ncbi:MAG: hypothetical protein D6814_18005 [Calditrichaeota bacterium]|nr:MAG: hypothetical protein D6814_18005 [Calditrichota bacterium]